MPRHSFIQMSKLPDLKGRISYIGSPDRQENLFAVYDTADTEFWTCLARESRQEFKRCGTEGKCIEAREKVRDVRLLLLTLQKRARWFSFMPFSSGAFRQQVD